MQLAEGLVTATIDTVNPYLKLCPGQDFCAVDDGLGCCLIMNSLTMNDLRPFGKAISKHFSGRCRRFEAQGDFQAQFASATEFKDARQRFRALSHYVKSTVSKGMVAIIETHDFYFSHLSHLAFTLPPEGTPLTSCLLYDTFPEILQHSLTAKQFFNAAAEFGMLFRGTPEEPTDTPHLGYLSRSLLMDTIDATSERFPGVDTYGVKVMQTMIKRFLVPVLGLDKKELQGVYIMPRHSYDIVLSARSSSWTLARNLASHMRIVARARTPSLLVMDAPNWDYSELLPTCNSCPEVYTVSGDPNQRQHTNLSICGLCLDVSKDIITSRKAIRMKAICPIAPTPPALSEMEEKSWIASGDETGGKDKEGEPKDKDPEGKQVGGGEVKEKAAEQKPEAKAEAKGKADEEPSPATGGAEPPSPTQVEQVAQEPVTPGGDTGNGDMEGTGQEGPEKNAGAAPESPGERVSSPLLQPGAFEIDDSEEE